MTESERCARIADSHVVGESSDDRVIAIARAIRVPGNKVRTEADHRLRCITIARTQLRGDDTDVRIKAIIAAIEDGTEAT